MASAIGDVFDDAIEVVGGELVVDGEDAVDGRGVGETARNSKVSDYCLEHKYVSDE